MEVPKTDTQLMSFLGYAKFYPEFIKGYIKKIYLMQQLMRTQERSSKKMTGLRKPSRI